MGKCVLLSAGWLLKWPMEFRFHPIPVASDQYKSNQLSIVVNIWEVKSTVKIWVSLSASTMTGVRTTVTVYAALLLMAVILPTIDASHRRVTRAACLRACRGGTSRIQVGFIWDRYIPVHTTQTHSVIRVSPSVGFLQNHPSSTYQSCLLGCTVC